MQVRFFLSVQCFIYILFLFFAKRIADFKDKSSNRVYRIVHVLKQTIGFLHFSFSAFWNWSNLFRQSFPYHFSGNSIIVFKLEFCCVLQFRLWLSSCLLLCPLALRLLFHLVLYVILLFFPSMRVPNSLISVFICSLTAFACLPPALILESLSKPLRKP